MDKNYYEILGVKPDATSLQIRNAYKKLALKFHPDTNSSDEFFSEYFKKIQQAYSILSDPKSRKEYDRIRKPMSQNNEKKKPSPRPLKVSIQTDQSKIIKGKLFHLTISVNTRCKEIQEFRINGAYIVDRIRTNVIEENLENATTKFIVPIVANRKGKIVIPAVEIVTEKGTKIKTAPRKIIVYKKPTTNKWSFNSSSFELSRILKKFSIVTALVIFIIFIVIIGLSIERNSNNSDFQHTDDPTNTLKSVKNWSKYSGNQLTNGDSPYDSFFGKGKYDKRYYNSINFINGQNYDAIVCLVDAITKETIRNEYVRAGSNFKMTSIPNGDYYIKAFYGNDWNPELELLGGRITGGFESNFSFSISDNPTDYMEMNQYAEKGEVFYSTFEVTLYKVEGGNMSSTEIESNQFFE